MLKAVAGLLDQTLNGLTHFILYGILGLHTKVLSLSVLILDKI